MSERDDVQPALTPEEWKQVTDDGDGGFVELGDISIAWNDNSEASWRAFWDRFENAPQWPGDPRPGVVVSCGYERMGSADSKGCHAIAAIALHRQPFGFTWADVDRLSVAMSEAQRAAGYACDNAFDGLACRSCQQAVDRFKGHLADLADRISALLPPRS